MKEALKNVLLSCISALLCLLLGEAVLRGVKHYRPDYEFEMWRYASELKQPLPDAALPFHHFPNREGRYYGVEIRTNSMGFRDREVDVPKPAGRKRIVLLGDSMALGWGVPFDNTVAKQLELMLNKTRGDFEVINMGTGNYNSAMEVELYKRKGLGLDANMVVLLYFINDTEPTPSPSPWSYKILSRSYLIARAVESISELKSGYGSDDPLMRHYRKIYTPGSAGEAACRAAIKELAGLCKDRGAELLIVNVPDLRRLKNYPFSFAAKYIRDLAASSGASFIDLLPVFEPYAGESLWVSPEDPHMNIKANSLAAGAIYKELISEGVGQ